MTSYARYYGARFPEPWQVADGVAYGPTGSESIGSMVPGTTTPAEPVSSLREMYANDWVHLPNIQNAGYAFAAERQFPSPQTAPESGVKVRKCNPSQSQLIAASMQSVGLEGTMQQITVWAKTLSPTYAWEPHRGDVIIIFDDEGEPVERWLIERAKRTVFGSQYLCDCKLSPKTSSQLQRP